MERPKIQIGLHEYRLTVTPDGENCCQVCDIYNYCVNRPDHWSNPECLMFGNKHDYHFKKIT